MDNDDDDDEKVLETVSFSSLPGSLIASSIQPEAVAVQAQTNTVDTAMNTCTQTTFVTA